MWLLSVGLLVNAVGKIMPDVNIVGKIWIVLLTIIAVGGLSYWIWKKMN